MYKEFMRFITPFLVGIVLLILGWIRGDIAKLEMCFTNHLHEHREIATEYRATCIMLNSRLAAIEARIK